MVELTTTQLGSLTNTQVASISTTALAELTTTAVGGLTSTQLGALTTTQLDSVTTTALGGLNSTQVKGLSTTQIDSLEATQLTALTSTALPGLTAAQVRASVQGTADDPAWEPADHVLLRLADALHDDCDIGDDLWRELRAAFAEDAILELLLLAGYYRTVAYLANGLRLPPEGKLCHPWPEVRESAT